MYRVLIADDEELMREAMKIMVSQVQGFQVVHTVSSGDRAFDICRSEKIDIAFLDIMMPGMSGIEVCHKVTKIRPETALYLVSAYKTFEFAREAIQTEVKEYLTKPVSSQSVKIILENYGRRNQIYTKEFDELTAILRQRDYKKMYYQIPEFVDELEHFCGYDAERMKLAAQKLGDRLTGSFGWPEEKRRSYTEILSSPEFAVSQKRNLEFWLFQLMNDIFQQLCSEKCPVMQAVFQYIEQHLSQGMGLNEIAENCNISQGYLSRIFMQQLNVSVLEYIHMRKLMIAKKYFTLTGMTVAEVAYRLGYNESSYFSKVFKKYEKRTVFQYKKASETASAR